MNDFWDQRYSSEEYIYGIEPNRFFKEQIDKINSGKILLLGEGEGRNAVYAAKNGWEVDAVDFSRQAKIKAEKLAEKNSTVINYLVKDISDYIPPKDYYDVVGLIFLHLNPELRKSVHLNVIASLKKGGRIILESYSKDQLTKTTGGPKNQKLLYLLDDIKRDFNNLNLIVLGETSENISEGKYHSGEASIIKMVASK